MAAGEGLVPSLDGLRAISILLVVLAHFVTPTIPGGLGVTVFFFISGFLIARLLFAESKLTNNVNLPAFYLRRFLRLYPVILVYVVFVVAVALLRGTPIHGIEITSVLFYFVNYLFAAYQLAGLSFTLPISQFWSLAVEEHFYFFIPLVVLLIRANPRVLIAICLGVCIGSLALRVIYLSEWPALVDTKFVYTHSETRFDSIAYGVLLAATCETTTGRRMVRALASPLGFWLAAIVLLGTLAYRDPFFRETARYSLQGLALLPIAGTLVFTTHLRMLNIVLNSSIAVWIGQLSYSLYVWHQGVADLVGTASLGWATPVVLVMASLAVAAASYYLIEKPFLRLRKNLRPRSGGVPLVQRAGLYQGGFSGALNPLPTTEA
jgi:peptidoglycan/LPS O-acetylase OafA/YrhL